MSLSLDFEHGRIEDRTIDSIGSNWVHHICSGPHQTHTMAPWVRRVFIHILPRLLVMRRPGQEAKNPIMRKYNQNKIKSSGSGGRIEDYILEQAMLTSSGHGAMSSATTTKIFQGFLLPPPPPPGSHQTSLHHNHQQAQHHQQDFFRSASQPLAQYFYCMYLICLDLTSISQ